MEEIHAELSQIDLDAITKGFPDLPAMRGMLSADLQYAPSDSSFMVVADAHIDSLFYEGGRVGELMFNTVYLPLSDKEHQVDMHLFRDRNEVAAINAYYKMGQTDYLDGNMNITDLPLEMVNPFIPDNMAKLTGALQGELAISGTASAPDVNGYVRMDSSAVYVTAVGSSFRFDKQDIRIKDNLIRFDKYNIYASGTNPFIIDGTVDIHNPSRMMANLKLTAQNMQLLNVKRNKESMVYGKLLVNLNSTIKGPLDALVMRGDLQLLGGTNVTYVMQDSPLTAQDRLADLVTFIDFSDTLMTRRHRPEAPLPIGGLDMLITIRIDQAVRLNADITPDQSSRVELEGGGDLSFQYTTQGEMILNGIEGCTGFGTQYDFSKNWQGMLIGNTSGCGIGLNVAAEYKKALSIPCGVVTYNDPAHAPDFFEQALEDGKADFFLMTRPLTVDMEYVNKLKEGRIDEIAPCTRCLHCHIGSNEANAQMAYCRVNALTQRVMREGGPATYELEPAATPKKVMVIGGGPAGMEAARIAAARGHNVTLYEKRGALGFMLDFAASVKGPHENLADLKNYLIRQLELNGVEVKTGTEVTQELINSEAPDAVILAAGGLRDTLTVDGDGSAPVVEMDNFMFTEMGDNVIVYGSNAQAFDAALWLTVHKKNVTIVTPNPASEFDMQQSQHAMRMMTTALYALGVKSYPQSAIKTVSGNMATLTLDTGVEMNIKCDAIVNGADMLPNTSLVDGIDCKEVYTIGDCANPFNIALAIRGGNDAGRAV